MWNKGVTRAGRALQLRRDVHGPADEAPDAHEVLLHQAPGAHGGGAHAEAVGGHGALVPWDGVPGELADFFG